MARTRKPDAPPRPTYLYRLPDSTKKLRYVEAYSKGDALAHVYPVEVKTLTAAEAAKLATLPPGTIECAIRSETQPLPLDGPQDDPPSAAGEGQGEPPKSQEAPTQPQDGNKPKPTSNKGGK